MAQRADVLSRIANAQTRVDRAQSTLADIEERRARAAEDDLNSWDVRVLEANCTLMDHKLDLAKAKLQLAEITGIVDGAVANSISLADAKVEVAEAEYDKAVVKLELERKKCSILSEDQKTNIQECVKQYEERLRIADEKLSLARDAKKKCTQKTTQESSCAAFVESPASGSKRKADVGKAPGDCKMPRTGSPKNRENLPAWQWRDSDGTWMNYSDFDSALIEEARNRREQAWMITIKEVTYIIDFEQMEQRRLDAGTEAAGSSGGPAKNFPRSVRRFQEEWSKDSMLQWNAHTREVYPSWEFQEVEVQCYPVQPGTGDFRKVESLLFDGSGRLAGDTHEICSVLRVQNFYTMSRYENEKKAISRKRSGGDCASC
jgi:hypothetical protein